MSTHVCSCCPQSRLVMYSVMYMSINGHKWILSGMSDKAHRKNYSFLLSPFLTVNTVAFANAERSHLNRLLATFGHLKFLLLLLILLIRLASTRALSWRPTQVMSVLLLALTMQHGTPSRICNQHAVFRSMRSVARVTAAVTGSLAIKSYFSVSSCRRVLLACHQVSRYICPILSTRYFLQLKEVS